MKLINEYSPCSWTTGATSPNERLAQKQSNLAMNIYLLRHGIAVRPGRSITQDDAARPLTAKGLKRMRKAARGLRRFNIAVRRRRNKSGLASAPDRGDCRRCARLESVLEEMSELAPESSVENLLFNLARFQNHSHVLLVGHEPLLSDLAAFLLTLKHPSRLGIGLKKGGMCRIEVDALPPPRTRHVALADDS